MSRGYNEREFVRISRHEDLGMLLRAEELSSRFDLTPQVLRSSRRRGGEWLPPGDEVL